MFDVDMIQLDILHIYIYWWDKTHVWLLSAVLRTQSQLSTFLILGSKLQI